MTSTSVVGEQFDTGEAGEDVDTLGGYLVTQVGRLPVRGEIISGPGEFEIEVLDADPRRVKRVRIGTRKDRSESALAGEAARHSCGCCKSSAARHKLFAPRRHCRNPMTSLRALIAAIILSWGWRRAAIAFIAGALSALAVAPFDAWPVLFITIPVTVWLIDGAGAGRLGGIPAAAVSGWWFGFWIFRRGPLLGRLRVPRRCRNVRLAFTDRGDGFACAAGAVHGLLICARPVDLDQRRIAHPCTRLCSHSQ